MAEPHTLSSRGGVVPFHHGLSSGSFQDARTKRVGVTACVALVALLLATPAGAAWYIFVEAASVEPSNADTIGGSIASIKSTMIDTTTLATEIGDDIGGTIDGNGTPQILLEGFGGNFLSPQTGTATVSGDIERTTLVTTPCRSVWSTR